MTASATGGCDVADAGKQGGIAIPDNTTLLEAARLAVSSRLHLIFRGDETLLSPVVPEGWREISVNR